MCFVILLLFFLLGAQWCDYLSSCRPALHSWGHVLGWVVFCCWGFPAGAAAGGAHTHTALHAAPRSSRPGGGRGGGGRRLCPGSALLPAPTPTPTGPRPAPRCRSGRVAVGVTQSSPQPHPDLLLGGESRGPTEATADPAGPWPGLPLRCPAPNVPEGPCAVATPISGVLPGAFPHRP